MNELRRVLVADLRESRVHCPITVLLRASAVMIVGSILDYLFQSLEERQFRKSSVR
jgi:hypothetical protein